MLIIIAIHAIIVVSASTFVNCAESGVRTIVPHTAGSDTARDLSDDVTFENIVKATSDNEFPKDDIVVAPPNDTLSSWGPDCGEYRNITTDIENLGPTGADFTVQHVTAIEEIASELRSQESEFRPVLKVQDILNASSLVIDLSRGKAPVFITQKDAGDCLHRLIFSVQQRAAAGRGIPARDMYIVLRAKRRFKILVSGYLYLDGRSDPLDSIYPIQKKYRGDERAIQNITFSYRPHGRKLQPRMNILEGLRKLRDKVVEARTARPDPEIPIFIRQEISLGVVTMVARSNIHDGVDSTDRLVEVEKCVELQIQAIKINGEVRPKQAYEGMWSCRNFRGDGIIPEGAFFMRGNWRALGLVDDADDFSLGQNMSVAEVVRL